MKSSKSCLSRPIEFDFMLKLLFLVGTLQSKVMNSAITMLKFDAADLILCVLYPRIGIFNLALSSACCVHEFGP